MSEITKNAGMNAKNEVIVGGYQSGANSVVVTLPAAVKRVLHYAVSVLSNLAARTVTLLYNASTNALTVGGLAAAATDIVNVVTVNLSPKITSTAAFVVATHTGASVTGAGVPADTYIVSVEDTSNATLSKPCTAGATITLSLWDRVAVAFRTE